MRFISASGRPTTAEMRRRFAREINMRMKFQMLLALGAAVLFATGTLAAQAKPAAPAQSAPAAPAKFVPPIRGEAPVNMTKPVSKRQNEEVVTTFKVKNPSATNSIAGLKISEFWYDKDGNPVSGDEFRYRKPLMPGEVIDVELRSPVNPKMARSQYKFEQSNGGVKPQVVAKF
jgi:hypothetical protein